MKFDKKLVMPLVVVVAIVLVLVFAFKGAKAPEEATVVNEDGSRSYENSIIGVSFDYPLDWTLGDNTVHGDVNGTPFGALLTSAEHGAIQFEHGPLTGADGKSLDNLSIAKQKEAVKCPATGHCEELTNANGVTYYRSTVCLSTGCFIKAVVPTGKYVMTFSISADGLLKASKREPTFKQILESLEII